MANLQALPPDLQRLQRRLISEVNVLSEAIANGEMTPEQWAEDMREIIGRGMNAAMMVGKDERSLTQQEMAIAERLTAIQFTFLNNFMNEIILNGWLDSYESRAQMYASSSTTAYSVGNVVKQAGQVLPLPSYPGEGTQCLTNCGCEWEVTTINTQKGNWDAYWKLGKTDNCQTCLQRANDWNPVRIRNFELIL